MFFAGIWVPQWTSVRKVMQRPLPDGLLSVVARGKSDQLPEHDDTDPTSRKEATAPESLI